MQDTPFRPPFFLRHAYIQTILASLKLRTWGNDSYLKHEKEMILETDSGARLLGYYTPQPHRKGKGLVILLHGWEGSAHSTYIITCGNHLYENGYEVFRLNFRDHGESHHLNSGLFYATLLDEVFQGAIQISRLSDGGPVFLVGFSLGGNFAIRIAIRCSGDHDDVISKAVSISPVLDPDKATSMIDNNPLILRYFLKKWRRSLSIKQGLFPELYDFSGIMRMKSLREMTEWLLDRYSDYAGAKEYFDDYAVHSEDTDQIRIPLSIITSTDDPIIPINDYYGLSLSRTTDLIVHTHGGHNGFLQGMLSPAWYDTWMLYYFDAHASSGRAMLSR